MISKQRAECEFMKESISLSIKPTQTYFEDVFDRNKVWVRNVLLSPIQSNISQFLVPNNRWQLCIKYKREKLKKSKGTKRWIEEFFNSIKYVTIAISIWLQKFWYNQYLSIFPLNFHIITWNLPDTHFNDSIKVEIF